MRLRLLATLAILSTGCSADLPDGTAHRRAAIQEGTELPDESFGLSLAEQNAVLAQTVQANGQVYQGCSATLVGDRVVVTAAHCLVLNQTAWLEGKEPPRLGTPATLRYIVGADIRSPTCTLTAKSVTIHPDAKLKNTPASKYFPQAIDHDIAVVLLAKSTLETCKQVQPIGLAESISERSIVDKKLLIGGFGSTDGTYDFSPKRYWGQIQGVAVEDQLVVLANIKKGFISFGDSGTGLLARGSDGRLVTYGASSIGVEGYTGFQRVDNNLSFIDGVATKEDFCGKAAAAGVCLEGRAVNCSSAGRPLVDDCAADGEVCAVEGDKAVCAAPEPDGGSAGADAGAEGPQAGDDDGGCRVAESTSPGSSGILLGLILLAVALRRRRRS